LKFIVFKVAAYEIPFTVIEVGTVTPFLPLPIIVDSGGVVGAFAFVITKPTVKPLVLRAFFFLRIIFK